MSARNLNRFHVGDIHRRQGVARGHHTADAVGLVIVAGRYALHLFKIGVLFAPLLLSHLLETFARIVHNRRALRGRLRRFCFLCAGRFIFRNAIGRDGDDGTVSP